MAIGVPLSELRRDLLAETNQSLNPAHGLNIRDSYDHQLRRTQQEQWRMFKWPHLHLEIDVPVETGQRYYDYPAGLPFDAIDRVWRKENDSWVPVDYGITPATYSVYGGEDTRQTPIQRWRNRVTFNATTGVTSAMAKFEIWPIPPEPTVIRVEGQAPLNPLIADTDVCVIDSILITLFAAAELLAVQKSEGAALKLQKAQQYQRKLMTNLGATKRTMRSLSADGGSMGREGGARPYIDYIPMGT